jgi:hypothetical protein
LAIPHLLTNSPIGFTDAHGRSATVARLDLLGDRNACAIAAIAVAAGQPYHTVAAAAQALGRRHGHGIRVPLFWDLIRKFGGTVEQCGSPALVKRLGRQPRVTLRTFLRQHPTGRFVVELRSHAVAVVDGILYDTALMTRTLGSHVRAYAAFPAADS